MSRRWPTLRIAMGAPARMIEVISPAGFEGFFRELSDMTAVGAPDPAADAAESQDDETAGA